MHQVQRAKLHRFAHGAIEIEVVAVAPEVCVDSFHRHSAQRPSCVSRTAGRVEARPRDVGTDDPRRVRPSRFTQHDRDGIRLLARCAAGTPDTQGTRCVRALHAIRENLAAQQIELGRVTKEIALTHGEFGEDDVAHFAGSLCGAEQFGRI